MCNNQPHAVYGADRAAGGEGEEPDQGKPVAGTRAAGEGDQVEGRIFRYSIEGYFPGGQADGGLVLAGEGMLVYDFAFYGDSLRGGQGTCLDTYALYELDSV